MRWLLMLGAELDYDGTLEAALARLAVLGRAEALSGTRVTAAREGGAQRYRNRLVQLAHPGPRDALVAELKGIERELGRGRRPGVPLDIDLLACDPGDGWRADAHALDKHEFDAAHVRSLLDEAGLSGIAPADRAARS